MATNNGMKYKAKKRTRQKNSVEDEAAWSLRFLEMAQPERQYAFDPSRRYRADFAWPRYKIMLEIDGGTWGSGIKCLCCGQRSGGGHNTGAGYEKDRERDARAIVLGWTVVRVTTDMVRDGRMLQIMAEIFEARGIDCTPVSANLLKIVSASR